MNPTEIPTTIVGNLTADPELRFTSTGRAVVNFSVAVNQRKQVRPGEWEDGETVFVPVTAWENLAENTAGTLAQGMPVMVYGKWTVDRWKDAQTGQDRERMKVDAIAVGPNLRWSVANVRRPEPRRPRTEWSGQDEAQDMIKEAESTPDPAPESKPKTTRTKTNRSKSAKQTTESTTA